MISFLRKMWLSCKNMSGYTRQLTTHRHQSKINIKNGTPTLPALHNIYIVPWIEG